MRSQYDIAIGGVQRFGRSDLAVRGILTIPIVVVVALAVAVAVLVCGAAPAWMVPLVGMASSPRPRKGRTNREFAVASSGVGSAAVGTRPRKLSPSHLKRPARFERWVEAVREVYRRQMRALAIEAALPDRLEPADVVLDDDEVERLARGYLREQLARLCKRHKLDVDLDGIFAEEPTVDVRAAMRQIADACAIDLGSPRSQKQSGGTRDSIEAHAIRSTATHQDLMRTLTEDQGTASDYRLASAVIEAMWLIRGDFELRRRWQGFTEMNIVGAWAYGMPMAGAKSSEAHYSGVSEDAVREAIFGSKKWKRKNDINGRDLIGLTKGLLDRNPSKAVMVANAAAINELRNVDPKFMKDFGRRVATDSLRLRASAEQRQSVSAADEASINGHLGCDMGSHGDKHWRGWMMLTLLDLSTGIPIAWLLLKASENEAPRLRELLLLAYEHLPWLTIDYLTADKAFDTNEAYRITEREFGIHLIAGLGENVSSDKDVHPHGETDGCPVHSEGCGQPMQLRWSEFRDGGRRTALPLKPRTLKKHDGTKRVGRTWFERRENELIVHEEARGRDHVFAVSDATNSRNNPVVLAALKPGQDVGLLMDCGLVEREHLRWGCECDPKAEVRTYPQDDWRLHTWAPWRDVHANGRPNRYELRQKVTSVEVV